MNGIEGSGVTWGRKDENGHLVGNGGHWDVDGTSAVTVVDGKLGGVVDGGGGGGVVDEAGTQFLPSISNTATCSIIV